MQTMTMTGKYNRKSLPSHLEVRGLSRGALETYTEALDSTDDALFHRGFIDTVNNAIEEYESGCSSPITAQYLDNSNNQWPANLTGNTTDRSSSYSTVTYDDFDREASASVQKLFDDLDSFLYENNGRGSGTHLPVHNECKDWSQSFPHLRVLGHQVLASSEHGYNLINSPSSSPAISNRTELSSGGFSDTNSYVDTSSLQIEGCHVSAPTYSTINSTPMDDSDVTYLMEEVFEVDGYYEDIIAVDSDSHEDLTESKAITSSTRQRRSRYPPVTPKACAKDDVANTALDVVWSIVTDAVGILLQRYSEHFIITHPMAIVEEDGHDASQLKLPQIMMTGSRLDSMNVVANNFRHGPGAAPSRLQAQAHNSNDQLRNFLRISKMEMNAREKTLIEDGTETPSGPMPTNRDNKGRGNGGRNSSGRKTHGRAKHLQPISDRVRTPNVDDEVHVPGIRGLGISVGKRLNSPPLMGSRTLPPINTSDLPIPQLGQTETTPPQTTRGANKRGYNRASSAVAEKDSWPSTKEKAAFTTETRPSTTHTVYPATDPSSGLVPQLLSSAALDRSNLRLRNSDVRLGITGSRVIGPHSVLDEEVEGRFDPVSHHSQWAPPHTPAPRIHHRKGAVSSVVR